MAGQTRCGTMSRAAVCREPVAAPSAPPHSVRVGEIQEFARYEFKYLLDLQSRLAIRHEIEHFMEYDGHVHPELGNSYFVRSLYFDDPHATQFYEKIDGVKSRRKYRIRTYSDRPDPEVPYFLEAKGRHNERSYKLRVAIDPEHLPIFYDPLRHDELLALYPDVPLIVQFVFESHRRGIAPRVLVDYRRKPFTSEFDMNFRLTFDSEITAIATDEVFPDKNASGWHQCKSGWTVLEIKFDRRIPAWFHRILQSHGMRRLSISKFCLGMESCGLAIDLS